MCDWACEDGSVTPRRARGRSSEPEPNYINIDCDGVPIDMLTPDLFMDRLMNWSDIHAQYTRVRKIDFLIYKV
jgi:hypothetical protein